MNFKKNINCRIIDYRSLKKFTDLAIYSSSCTGKETKVYTNNESCAILSFIQPSDEIKIVNSGGAFILKNKKDMSNNWEMRSEKLDLVILALNHQLFDINVSLL